MRDRHAELMLATLYRAHRPLGTGSLMDEATGLAVNEGWRGRDLQLNRKRVAGIMQKLISEGLVREAGVEVDEEHRRTAPTYELVSYEAAYPVPPPQSTDEGVVPARASRSTLKSQEPFDSLSRSQMLVLLDAQDELLGVFARNMAAMASFAGELSTARERCRNRLVAAGILEEA